MSASPVRSIGRYVLTDEIGAGGMGTVHVGHLDGPGGFSRTVAIKRLHPHLAKDPEFAAMLLDEARVAARIAHPNVVATLDVVRDDAELLIVMEYVHGESLSRLQRAQRETGTRIPVPIAVAIMVDALHGLNAAHEATSAGGMSLEVVHRDVSPQNIVVGRDGIARVLDFGVAKASSRIYSTRDGQVKGKLGYMAPEQLSRKPIDRRVDVFAASVVLWEVLTGTRLFSADAEAETAARMLFAPIPAPTTIVPDLPPALDEIVLHGLDRDPDRRFSTAREMASALEATRLAASRAEVGAWVELLGGVSLSKRTASLEPFDRTTPSRQKEQRPSESAIVTERFGNEHEAALPASVTTVTTSGASKKNQRRLLPLLLGLVAITGAATAAQSYRSFVRRPEAALVSPPAAPEESHSPSEPAGPPSASAVASASIAPTPVASLTATQPAPRGRPPRTRPTSAPARSAPNCDPPYYFEADGAKHLKTECLR